MSVRPLLVSTVLYVLFNVSSPFAGDQPPQACLRHRRAKAVRRWSRSWPARFRWVSRTETGMADAMSTHAMMCL